MKIAIPVVNGNLSAHFGHCQEFALIEADPGGKSIESVQMLTPPPHEPGALPRWLAGEGAELILAGGMGRRAQDLFGMHGIKVIIGAPTAPPEDVAASYLAGTLETGDNVCDH